MERPSSLRQHFISVFILLNLTVIFVANIPNSGSLALERFVTQTFSPSTAYRLKYIAYRLRLYANITGLDPRWEMFSHVKGEDWRYLIEGLDQNGWRVLPLAGQHQRSFWQDYLFDFKEGKFRYSTAANPRGYQAYGRYLCRLGQIERASPIKEVRISVQYQRILEQREALRNRRHFDPLIRTFPLARLICS